MSDSYTEQSAPEESVVALHAKAEYENAINLSQHLPAAKIISEMVDRQNTRLSSNHHDIDSTISC